MAASRKIGSALSDYKEKACCRSLPGRKIWGQRILIVSWACWDVDFEHHERQKKHAANLPHELGKTPVPLPHQPRRIIKSVGGFWRRQGAKLDGDVSPPFADDAENKRDRHFLQQFRAQRNGH